MYSCQPELNKLSLRVCRLPVHQCYDTVLGPILFLIFIFIAIAESFVRGGPNLTFLCESCVFFLFLLQIPLIAGQIAASDQFLYYLLKESTLIFYLLNGFVQLIRAGNSIRQKWVKYGSGIHKVFV